MRVLGLLCHRGIAIKALAFVPPKTPRSHDAIGQETKPSRPAPVNHSHSMRKDVSPMSIRSFRLAALKLEFPPWPLFLAVA
jgi:hypothetical protein